MASTPFQPISREQWLEMGTEQERQQWAKELPLAWLLEYRPTILFPGKGHIPFELYPFQQEFVSCRDSFRAINKPRQCGISTAVAAEVAWEFCNVPGAQIVIISKDKDAAVNFHNYVYEILRSVKNSDPNFPRLLKENERQTTNSIGSKITSLAAGKEAGRSFSATHLVIDEAAFQQYAYEIWQAAAPALSRTAGRATVISTPKGRTGLFAQIFETPGNMGFTCFNFGWWDVPDYNPHYEEMIKATTKKAKDDWIQKARSSDWYKINRAAASSELSWRQEFEGAFDAHAGAVFSTRSIERSFHRNWLENKTDPSGIITDWWTSEKKENRLYVTGEDLGRKNDPTILLTYDVTDYDPNDLDENGRFNSPAVLVDYKFIEAGSAEWSELENITMEHLAHWQPDAQHDGTGAGDPFSEAVGGYSEPFMFTKQSKEDMIGTIQHAFDHGAVKLPKIPRLFREHQRYIWDDKDIEQDTVMANGMAIDLFHSGSSGDFTGFKKIGFMNKAVPA